MQDSGRSGRIRQTLRSWRPLAAVAMAMLATQASVSTAFGQGGTLETVRDDVRADAPPHESAAPDENHRSISSGNPDDPTCPNDDGWGDLCLGVLTFPYWAPHLALENSDWVSGRFLSYPYENDAPGWMSMEMDPIGGKHWAVQFGTEMFETFEPTRGITSHLLIDTQSRFGLDTSTTWFEERLPGRRFDHMLLGDCNLTFRFAQSPQVQFRTGLGFNWLDDAQGTDFGFNFTYSVDVFPCKPWAMSASLDWGTLGRAELFRFRTTAGAMFHGIEAYIGFEYLDIDRTQLPGLLAGVQIRR
jgi:hypothetical protein